MTLTEIMRAGVLPAYRLLPSNMQSARATAMLLAIGLQESRFTARRQLVGSPPKPVGPAKSFWQGEQGGGMVAGVRTHVATRVAAARLYRERNVQPTNAVIWNAIENDDVLAAGLARLLLWSDPAPLPALDNADGAWALYIRTWRPGQPHRATWDAFHARAVAEALKY